jgi:hypothetical protein
MVIGNKLMKANDDYIQQHAPDAPVQKIRKSKADARAFTEGVRYGSKVGLERQIGQDPEKLRLEGK